MEQNGLHLANEIWNAFCRIKIVVFYIKQSLNFVPENSIDNKVAVVQASSNYFSQAVLLHQRKFSSLARICFTAPQCHGSWRINVIVHLRNILRAPERHPYLGLTGDLWIPCCRILEQINNVNTGLHCITWFNMHNYVWLIVLVNMIC